MPSGLLPSSLTQVTALTVGGLITSAAKAVFVWESFHAPLKRCSTLGLQSFLIGCHPGGRYRLAFGRTNFSAVCVGE
jgi:hypothetical protein